MNIDFLMRLLLFLVLLLVQALVFNHIHLFGFATPLAIVWFVASFRRNYPRWAVLVWSFLLGLMVDVFSNTPGLAASAMTLVGLIQPYLFELYLPRDSADDLLPSMRTLGAGKYVSYLFILTLVYALAFFTIEAFTFFDWMQWGLNILCSSALTVVLILAVDNLRKTDR